MSSEKWAKVIETLEEIHAVDLPYCKKKAAIRVCEHLYRRNPAKGRVDPQYSLAKVANYLEEIFTPYRRTSR